MKKAFMCVIGAMMILSLAACTPTTEKAKTGEVKQTQAAKNGIADKNPDPDAPKLEVVSVYTVSEDGTKLDATMEAIEEKNEQTLVDLLVQYGVLEEGTKALGFTAEGEPASKEVGPAMVAPPGFEVESNLKEYGTLNLSQLPSGDQEMKLQAVANTFIENMSVIYLTVQVNGETVAENLTQVDAGK